MTEVEIRPALPSEATALAALAAATFPLACPEGTKEADIAHFIANNLTAAHFDAYLTDPQAHVIVAASGNENDAELLGYTLGLGGVDAQPNPENLITGSPTWYLSKLYALPAAHGSGIAHKLVSAMAQYVKGRGAQSLWLATNVDNERARRFYHKYGFIQRGTKIFMVGAGAHHDFTFELMV